MSTIEVAFVLTSVETGPLQFGKWLIIAGIAICLAGVIVMALGHLGLFKLPGDLQFGSKNWRVYIPITTCIIISIILTIILRLINYFRR